MNSVSISLTGLIPAKKNSKRLVPVGGRIIPLPSPAYERWQKEVGGVLQPYERWGRGVQKPLFINISLFDKKNKDGSLPKRTFDLTNKAESILDALTDYQVISDDNYTVVPRLHLRFGGYRPEQGAEIHIAESPVDFTDMV